MHLLLPLAAGILLVCGLLLTKRCGYYGVRPWTTMYFANLWSSLLFSVLWLFGGQPIDTSLWYQPIVIAGLFMAGLGFTFLAVEVGDVSIATPVLGIKVIFVALLTVFFGQQTLPSSLWLASLLAAVGIALIQWTGRADRRKALLTIMLAISASSCFATFDVLVQWWSPAWGAGRLLPLVYWTVGLVSLSWTSRVQFGKLREKRAGRILLLGTFLVGAQAICIVLALAIFGDAVRVNIIYALRGLWGVLLAWLVARWWGDARSAERSSRQMQLRALGALLLTVAVISAIQS